MQIFKGKKLRFKKFGIQILICLNIQPKIPVQWELGRGYRNKELVGVFCPFGLQPFQSLLNDLGE